MYRLGEEPAGVVTLALAPPPELLAGLTDLEECTVIFIIPAARSSSTEKVATMCFDDEKTNSVSSGYMVNGALVVVEGLVARAAKWIGWD
jgi:hypothetical protein